MSANICHARKLIFVHNPKTAGSSFCSWLGFNSGNHGFPTINTPVNTWNEYTVIVVVRDPIDRALSAYRHHTDESYDGIYTKRYPDIHEWNPEHYFNKMVGEQTYVLARQYKYTQHLLSNKEPDFLLKFEEFDTSDIASHLGIENDFPFENKGPNKKFVPLSEEYYLSMIAYYKVDYLQFGYRPKPYDQFIEDQLVSA